jgi:hypothetical protein
MSKRGRVESNEYSKFIECISNIIVKNSDNTSEDLEMMLNELQRLTNDAENVLELMKNKPRAFSTIKYNDLYNMNNVMHWNLPKDLFDLDEYEPQLIRIPMRILNTLKEQVETTSYTIGVVSQLDNEAKKKKFIDVFVDPCIQLFKGEIINDIEANLDSTAFKGHIEYILKAFSEIIIVIIEAKKDIEYQSSYGQIMAELYNAWIHNNKQDHPVYGVLTTGSDWRWWKYDGKMFSTSRDSTQLRRRNPKSIPIVASKVYSIVIESWIKSCELYLPEKIDQWQKIKDSIWNAKTDEEACHAFHSFKQHIDVLRHELNREEYTWNIDPNYM